MTDINSIFAEIDSLKGSSKAPQAAAKRSKRADVFSEIDNRANLAVAPQAAPMTTAVPYVPQEEMANTPFEQFSDALTHNISGGILGLTQMGVNAFGTPEQSNRFQQILADREATYQQRVPDSLASYAGAAIGMISDPTAAVPAAKAYNIASKASPLVRGALSGGAGMMTAPVTEGDNFLLEKGKQVGMGAGGGAILGPLGEGIAGRIGRYAPEEILESKANALLDAGQPGSGLVAEDAVKNQLINQMRGGVKPNVAIAQRQADFARTGIDPTLGQITRDPAQFSFEKNIAKTETGIPLAERYAQQGQKIRQNIGELGADAAASPYEAGVKAVERLKAIDAPRKQAVNDAYSAVRESDGALSLLDDEAFIDATINNLEKNVANIAVAEKVLPAEVRSYITGIQNGDIPFDIRTMEQFDRLLSNAKRAANKAGDGNKGNAIQQVRDALDGTPLYREAGAEAKAKYDYAKGLARERFQTIEKNPALKAALNEADPDKFVNKYVVSGTTDQMKALRELTTDDAAFGDVVRSQVAEHLRNAAFKTDAAGDVAFSQAAYNKALKAMGDDKLGTFFTPDEVADMNAWGRTMAYIQASPEGSAVNYTNSAGQMINFLKGLSFVDKAAKFTIDPVIKAGKVEKALKAKIPKNYAPDNLKKKESGMMDSFIKDESGSVPMSFAKASPDNSLSKTKVVDDVGEPLTVYHGTDETFSEFKKPDVNRMAARSNAGFWFSTDKADTKSYGKNLMEAKLDIRNPLEIEERELDFLSVSTPMEELHRQWKADGYDGLKIKARKADPITETPALPEQYVAFDSSQIKLIDRAAPTNDVIKKGSPEWKKNFDNWFKDSKVVDEAGEPLVVYHGSLSDFDVFDSGVAQKTSGHRFDAGFHFGDIDQSNDIISRFVTGSEEAKNNLARAGKRPNITPVYLDIKNPMRVDDMIDAESWSNAIAEAREGGFDGLVYRNAIEGDGTKDAYVAFDSTQIKSAIGNKGKFDPKNSNIMAARIPLGLGGAGLAANELQSRGEFK